MANMRKFTCRAFNIDAVNAAYCRPFVAVLSDKFAHRSSPIFHAPISNINDANHHYCDIVSCT